MGESNGQATAKVLQSPLKRPLHVGFPNVLDRAGFLSRVERILDDRMFSNDGPFVKELEAAVGAQFDIPHVIAVCNATIGLELVLETIETKGEVILPSFTFVATAHAVERAGFTPVFCDATSEHGLLDPKAVRRLITPKTVAILPVHVYGNVCAVEELQAIADEHKLKLIFDSAHALGVKYKDRFVGVFGDAEVFSLHATKFINGFEGGLIATTDDELARKLRMARNFGFVNYDQVDSIGTNAKLTEIHAAMALTNFEHFQEIIDINRRIYLRYKAQLPSWLDLMGFCPETKSNFQYVVVRCDADKRDPLVKHLHAHQILARRYFYPGVHRMGPYQALGCELPVTESLADSVLCLPTGQSVTDEVVDYVCEVIDRFKR